MEKFLDYFKPEHYELNLKINRQHEILSGTVKIQGVIQSETVKFHAGGMQIGSVEYMRDFYSENDKGTPCEFTYDGETLSIPVSAKMAPEFYRTQDSSIYASPEEYSLELAFVIRFETKLNRNMQGCYLSTYEHLGEERRLVATQFESHYAREAFPCIDEPAAKASFSLVLTVEDLQPDDVVLANTPCANTYRNSFYFERTPRMSTYLLAWVIGPLQSVSTFNRNGVKVSSYGALNQPITSLVFANETAARALEYFDERFGIKYPLPKLDQVALPDFEAGAMENWGLVTYRESMMLADITASLATKQSVAVTITHELSHQWFGDLVTMSWWDDLWLNESFATIMEYYATDALYPEFKIWQDFFTSDCLIALRRDSLPGVQAVHQEVKSPAEIATLFDSAIVYAKGARLILMLIRLMGEDRFNQGVKYYFDKYKYQNTVGDDLWVALQNYADFDVRKFMDTWISQPGYPMVKPDGEQHRFYVDGRDDPEQTKWPLPEIKDDMSGHYLLNLNDTEFGKKLTDFAGLSMEQKLRLLIDRMLLAKTPIVSSDSLLDLLPKFVDEPSAAVWGIIASIVSDLKLFIQPESKSEQDYKHYLYQLTSKHFSGIDYGRLTDIEAVQMRDIWLGLAYYTEDEPTLRHLASLYQDDLSQLDTNILDDALRAKLYFDEAEVVEPWIKKYQIERDPEIKAEIMFTLASFVKQPESISKLMDLLNRPEIVRPQDHLFLYIYLLRNHRSHDQALDWIFENWDYVVKLTGDKSIEDYPRCIAGTIETPENAQKFFAFFDQKAKDPILSRVIEMAHASIDAKLKLIELDTAGVRQKLEELTKKEK